MPRSAAQIAEAEPPQVPEDRSSFLDRNGAPAPAGQEIAWIDVIPSDQWPLYKQAIQAVRRAGVRFLVGGGFGLAAYTGRWRNTKDMDLYVLPSDRERTIQALTDAGFGDYYDTLPYDRGWIYRSTRDGIIIDIIWSMANRRAEVDAVWFQNARSLLVRDEMIEL
ncbi:MAG TPA: nucleotidyltransferase family protein, partial [Verrucomicrobiae bacterium]|nr:nucleotidyltransferase family protein [Verrucomicrobiae bacterium]